MNLGQINNLTINRDSNYGYYLIDDEEGEVLLPNKYISKAMKIGQKVDVFIYTDSENRIVATTQTPKLTLNEFAALKVIDESKFGFFVDWGLEKDLLIPTKFARLATKVGDTVLVHLTKNHEEDRLIGVQQIDRFLSKKTAQLKKGQKVNIIIANHTPLGVSVVVENTYMGVIHASDIFQKFQIGQTCTAFIKKIREDGKLDISTQPIGSSKDKLNANKILELLQNNNGELPYNYKSDSAKIKDIFEMSKKNFKKALTYLKENNKINISDDGINESKK